MAFQKHLDLCYRFVYSIMISSPPSLMLAPWGGRYPLHRAPLCAGKLALHGGGRGYPPHVQTSPLRLKICHKHELLVVILQMLIKIKL